MKKPKSDRPKFPDRTFLLGEKGVVDRIVAVLANVPIDPLRPLQVVIREMPIKRSLDQNAYYWLRIGEIADQAWNDGRQFASDVWHEYVRRNILPDTIIDKDDVERSKWIELPDGTLTVISTTELSRKTFADYTTMLEAFGVSLGVEFSADPRQTRGY